MKAQKYVVVPPPPPPSPMLFDLTLTYPEVQVLFGALSDFTNNTDNSEGDRALSDKMWEALYAAWIDQSEERAETKEEAG